MIRILFICHGNICRSPMAEFIMKELIRKQGKEKDFYISSAATSTEEIGNDMYPPAKRKLKEKNIPFSRRQARQLKRNEYENWDYILYMDSYNKRNLSRILPIDPNHKIQPLLDRDVADPWYTDDFEQAYIDIYEGCSNWLGKLLK